MLPLPNNFRYLNREGRWLDFHWTGLALTPNGALELLPSPALAGTAPTLNSVSAATAPSGVAVDSSGRIFYRDPDSNQIYLVDGCSSEATALGCLIEGMGLAPLNQPRGLLLLDTSKRLVVVDSGNHRILFFDTAEFALRDVWGQSDVTSTPIAGTAPGQFNTPWTVSSDGDGNLYVLDYGNKRIQKFRQTGEPDLSFATKLQSMLVKSPGALAVCGKGADVRVFIFDIDTQTIYVFDSKGDAVAGSDGDAVTIPASSGVLALAASADTLYVGDNLAEQILTYRIASGYPSSGSAVGFDGPIAAMVIAPSGGLVVLPGAGTPPLHINASGAFLPLGVLWSDAISSGSVPAVWGRLRAELDNADGAHVEFHYSLSNSSTPPPVSPTAVDPFNDPAWKALPNDVEDFSLAGDKVQYLFVGAVFRSDRSGTPSLKQIKATFNDPGYLPYLPAIYRQPLVSGTDFLPRFLSLFQGIFDDVEGEVDTLARYFNPYAAPVEALPWLASWLAVDLEQGEPVAQIRTTIARAFHRYQWRGTAEGLRLALLEDAGIHATIVQPIANASFWNFQQDRSCSGSSSTPSGVSLGSTSTLPTMEPGGAVLGSTAQLDHSYLITDEQFGEPLFYGVAYQFVVEVYSSEITGKGRRELIHQIVEREKPAHTMWRLAVIEPSMRVGMQARTGIDTIVAGVPGPSALGAPGTSDGVRLGGEPSPRIGASRLGQNLRLEN